VNPHWFANPIERMQNDTKILSTKLLNSPKFYLAKTLYHTVAGALRQHLWALDSSKLLNLLVKLTCNLLANQIWTCLLSSYHSREGTMHKKIHYIGKHFTLMPMNPVENIVGVDQRR